MDAAKSLGSSILKSRKGAIPLGIDRLATQAVSKISSVVFSSFAKTATELVDPEQAQALRDINVLADTESRRLGRYVGGAALGAVTNPVVKAVASGLGAAAQYRKKPLEAAMRVGKATLLTPRSLVTNAALGGMGGSIATAVKDHVDAAAARQRVKALVDAEA